MVVFELLLSLFFSKEIIAFWVCTWHGHGLGLDVPAHTDHEGAKKNMGDLGGSGRSVWENPWAAKRTCCRRFHNAGLHKGQHQRHDYHDRGEDS